MYGSGKGLIWVQPLVAKWVSSFHKWLLWQSDMQCDPAYVAYSKQCQGEIENHVGSEQMWWYTCLQGMLLAWTLIWRSFESWYNGGCTIWTTWHYGTPVESTDEITWCNGTSHLNSFQHFYQCEYNTVTLFIKYQKFICKLKALALTSVTHYQICKIKREFLWAIFIFLVKRLQILEKLQPFLFIIV